MRNIYARSVRIIGSTRCSRKLEVEARILASLVRYIEPKISDDNVKPTLYKL